MLKIFISGFIFFSIATLISIFIFRSAMEKSAATINLQSEYKQVGFDILNGLDLLSRLARSYGEFGQKFYYDEYMYEFNTVNTRTKTIVHLKELGINEEGLALIVKAIAYSNVLAEIEANAFKAVENKNYEQARKILFGKEYEDRRNQIATTIKEFQLYVNSMAEAEVNHARKIFARTVYSTIVLIISTIITAVACLIIITKKIKSISRLTEISKEITNGNMDILIISNAKDELGDLTRSFAVMLDSIKGITSDLSYQAKTDALTQVANRHSFLTNAPSFFDFHIRLGKPITILFFDIDDFKKINDEFGHSFGDDVLKNFASIVSEAVRCFDLFCRYGGEEFILLLSDADQSCGMMIGNRIIGSLEESVFPKNPGFQYTASIGLFSSIPQQQEKVEEYIDKADEAMYIAKRNGKNRIEVYRSKSEE